MKRKSLITAGILGASVGLLAAKIKLIEKRSISSKLLESYLKYSPSLFNKLESENPEYVKESYRENMKEYVAPEKLVKSCNLVKSSVYENTYELSGHKSFEDYTILYLHGGAYWVQPSFLQWKFLRKLVNKINAKAIVPIYPKAPSYNYKDVYNMILPIYEDLLEKVDLNKLIIMGDSAGGGLSLAFCEFIKEKNLPQPKDIILLSPWLDLTMNNENIKSIQKFDPLLNSEDLKRRGKYYAYDLPTDNYLVSPIYGDISNLGRISIFTGTYDILSADCRKFNFMARNQHININYFEYPKMLHIFSICPTAEGNDSINKICEIIKN